MDSAMLSHKNQKNIPLKTLQNLNFDLLILKFDLIKKGEMPTKFATEFALFIAKNAYNRNKTL